MATRDGPPIEEVLRATHRMLQWRGQTGAAHAGPTGTGFEGVFLAVAEARTLLVVTDSPRVTSQQVRQPLDAATADGLTARLQLVSRFPVNVHAHCMTRVTVLSWNLLLTYPLDHDLMPPHRHATAPEDLERLAQLRLPRGPAWGALPALRADDPIVQYLALSVGDVMRIDRRDGTVYYRVVVSAR